MAQLNINSPEVKKICPAWVTAAQMPTFVKLVDIVNNKSTEELREAINAGHDTLQRMLPLQGGYWIVLITTNLAAERLLLQENEEAA